jgi:hypothetical protein
MSEQRVIKAGLIAFGLYGVVTGAWSLFAPGSFYDEIALYGAENSHFLGDLGSFSLPFGVMMLLAVNRPTWQLPLLILGAGWFGVHAINHFFDIGEARTDARGTTDALLLLGGALIQAYLAVLAARSERAAVAR